jgi:2-dehydropantoate 2-reductase
MRILVLGAGGIGGYYGGRAAAGGADVTFLVRPRRAAQIAANGLVIKSPMGDLTTPAKTVLAEDLAPGYDAIVLSCKAYDLDSAIAAIRPAAAGAMIIPQLNGMRHLDRLDAEFGADHVLGGMAGIGITLDEDGTIRHLNKGHLFAYGARAESQQAFCDALEPHLADKGFDLKHSKTIIHDMWEKWVFLCSLAGMTSLMRDNVGAIVRASDDGAALMLAMLADCAAVAEAAGYPQRAKNAESTRSQITDRDGGWAASMLRDLQRGGAVEADHVVGDMLARAKALGREAWMLKAAYTHLKVYENSRT